MVTWLYFIGIEFPRRSDSSGKSASFRPNCVPDGDKYDLGVFQTTNIEELFGEGAVNYTCYNDNGVAVSGCGYVGS